METKKVGNISVNIVSNDTPSQKNNFISENDAEMDNRATAAVRSAIERAKICKKPVAKYDIVTKRAYMEYADGVREYVN